MKKLLKVATIAILFVGLIGWNYSYKTSFDAYFNAYNHTTSQLKDIKDGILSLNYSIQESVLFQFYNNDAINKKYKKLQQQIDTLNAVVKKDSHVQKDLKTLQELLKQKYEVIKKLYISNAKVKNSITYLSSQLYKLDGFDKEYTHLIVNLVNYFFRVKNTLDYSHNTNNELFNQVLHYKFDDPKKQKFNKMIKIHTNLLLNEFPYYIQAIENATSTKEIEYTQNILDNYILQSHKTKTEFNIQILVIVFASIGALFVILYLLLHSEKEKTKIIRLQNEFKKSIKTDLLTGLPNRTAYYSDARDKNNMHLMLINLIEFRNINSIFGMNVGDFLLKEVSYLLEEYIEKDKSVNLYRIGADEFAISYENVDDSYVFLQATQIMYYLENTPIFYKDIKIPISVNIGIAAWTPHLLNAQICIKELHNSFGEKIKVYDESLNDLEQIKSNIAMVQDVKEALEKDNVVAYFQPIVDTQSKQIQRYEALVRIEQNAEVLSPFLFLDIAKKVKLYNDISHRMMEKSIQMIREKDLNISFNISIEDILESKNSNYIYDLVKNNSDIAQKITFEIVESEQIRNYNRLLEFIDIVKSYGCKIAIDDFGSGYSNFDYLFNFDVDFLKIDGSLIKNINSDNNSYMIVKTIVAFAKEAGIETVAEFVHSQEIDTVIKELGIDYGQGYYYGKPAKL